MPTLLLADDEIYVTSVIGRKLAPDFDRVVTARDGHEAFELALRESPTLIISDLQMPLCGGLELALRLRADPRTAAIPMILLTARGHLLAPDQLARTNIRITLPKPFSIRQLRDAVLTLLAPASSQAA